MEEGRKEGRKRGRMSAIEFWWKGREKVMTCRWMRKNMEKKVLRNILFYSIFTHLANHIWFMNSCHESSWNFFLCEPLEGWPCNGYNTIYLSIVPSHPPTGLCSLLPTHVWLSLTPKMSLHSQTHGCLNQCLFLGAPIPIFPINCSSSRLRWFSIRFFHHRA